MVDVGQSLRRALAAGPALVALAASGASAPPAATTPAGGPVAYGTPRLLCRLADPAVKESSGLAPSRLREGALWTHNDSGDAPRLYAFDAQGRSLGTFSVPGAEAHDWEDMASCAQDGRSLLLLADVGDNARKRPHCTLYIVAEPPLPAVPPPADAGPLTDREAELVRTIRFRYPAGPADCEGVAVDPGEGVVYLAQKAAAGKRQVYALPLAPPPEAGELTARPVAPLLVRGATAMDMSPDGLRAVILTYGQAFEYARRPGEAWADAFRRRPRIVGMPPQRQGEALCYGRDGVTLYTAGEGSPALVWEVPPADGASAQGADADAGNR